MKRRLATLLTLIAAGPVLAEDKSGGADAELNDAKAVLTRAAEAARKVESVSYSAKARSTGWLESRVPSAEGSVVLAGKAKTPQDMGKFRVTTKTTPPGSSDAVELTGGSDGDTFFLIDPREKTVYEDIDPAVMGRSSRLLQGLILRPFTQAEPYADELKSEKVELKESVKVGDEDCYQVELTGDSGKVEAVWFFSKKDLLPRRRDRILANPEGETATRELVVSDLMVNPPSKDDPFKAAVPEGFKKTDDFAP